MYVHIHSKSVFVNIGSLLCSSSHFCVIFFKNHFIFCGDNFFSFSLLIVQNVKYNTEKTSKEKDKIRKKQLSIADKFRKVSDALAIKCKKAQIAAEKDSSKIEKKYKTTDIMDTMPDSAAASSIF